MGRELGEHTNSMMEVDFWLSIFLIIHEKKKKDNNNKSVVIY